MEAIEFIRRSGRYSKRGLRHQGIEAFGSRSAEGWWDLQQRISGEVCKNGFDADEFVQSHGAKELDASLLLRLSAGSGPTRPQR